MIVQWTELINMYTYQRVEYWRSIPVSGYKLWLGDPLAHSMSCHDLNFHEERSHSICKCGFDAQMKPITRPFPQGQILGDSNNGRCAKTFHGVTNPTGDSRHTKILLGDMIYSRKCALQWRHNGHDSVSNHQPHDCLLNRLFRRKSKKTSKLRVTGLCAVNSLGIPHKWPVTRKMFPFDDVIMEQVSLFCLDSINGSTWYIYSHRSILLLRWQH